MKILPKLLTIGLPVLIVLLLGAAGVLYFYERRPFFAPPPEEVTLTYWGLLEPREVLQPLIKQYEEENPRVTVDYTLQSYSTFAQYKETLYTRLQQGAGPDIARMHATWPRQFYKYLSSAPPSLVAPGSFAETFYPPAASSCQVEGKIYALPLMYDGLVLIYNKDLFKDAAISSLPETWKDFRDIAIKLTNWEDNDPKKSLLQSGAALGASSNISHASDILGLMLNQSEVEVPSQIDSQAAQDVFTFYTNFVLKDRVWNETWPQDISAFANGKVGMVIAPYWQYVRMQNDSPDFAVGIAPVPQIPTLEETLTQIGWANFWVDGVSATSEHPDEAWKFLKFLAEKTSQEQWMQKSRALKGFSFASARQDLKSELAGGELAPVVRWAQGSSTSAISSCAGNTDYERAVVSAVSGILAGDSSESQLTDLQKELAALVSGNSLGLQGEPLTCALASFGMQLPGIEEVAVEPTSTPGVTTTATPSPTPTAVPTGTPGAVSPTPTASPSPTPTGAPSPTLTITPTPTPTPTDADLDTGAGLPGVLIMGVGMLVLALGLLY